MAKRLSEDKWFLSEGDLVRDDRGEIVGPTEVRVDYRHVPRIMVVRVQRKEVLLSGNDFAREVRKRPGY